MAKTVKGFFSNVKKDWDIVTYVSPEEKERRRIGAKKSAPREQQRQSGSRRPRGMPRM